MLRSKLPSKAIETGVAMLTHQDMSDREKEIIEEIISITGFKPVEVIWRSDYVGTGRIGAVHYRGAISGREVVLKIQGVKPEVSEAIMIEQFGRQNRSRLIRPPVIYDYIPWNDEKQYEALVMESVTGKRVIESGRILDQKTIAEFFEIYLEYKKNCVTKPWLPMPNKEGLIDELLERMIKISAEVKPTSPLREESDRSLIMTAAKVLKKAYEDVDLEFLHGHFSVEDLMYQGNQIVLFSNLFWKWKYPCYDLVFGYHWEMFTLARVSGITGEMIEKQRQLWKVEMQNIAQKLHPEINVRYLQAALLERAIAGLCIDTHAYLDENDPITKHLVGQQRREVRELTDVLS